MTDAAEHDWRERIGEVRQVLEARLDEDVPLEELADVACASMFHFHRLFRAFTGETVRGYVRRLRLERAAHHLSHGGDDILRVALDAGYDSHEAFTRAFKRQFGVTPSALRNEKRELRRERAEQRSEDDMDIRIETIDARHIAFVRHVGPYDEVGDAWKTLMKWGWSKMMFGRPDTFGLCFDDPEVTAPERVRYEACMVVGDKTKAKGDVHVRALPAAVYAVTAHAGALDAIGTTYTQLLHEITSRSIDGRQWRLGDPPSLERYLCDPRKVKPEDMRTEIAMPVLP